LADEHGRQAGTRVRTRAAVSQRERIAGCPNSFNPALSTGGKTRPKHVDIGNGVWGKAGEVGRERRGFCRVALVNGTCFKTACAWAAVIFFLRSLGHREVEGHCDGRLGLKLTSFSEYFTAWPLGGPLPTNIGICSSIGAQDCRDPPVREGPHHQFARGMPGNWFRGRERSSSLFTCLGLRFRIQKQEFGCLRCGIGGRKYNPRSHLLSLASGAYYRVQDPSRQSRSWYCPVKLWEDLAHLLVRQAPTHGTGVFLSLLGCPRTGDWDSTLAHEPIEGDLPLGLATLGCPNLLESI
jgi:hypothetical protein